MRRAVGEVQLSLGEPQKQQHKVGMLREAFNSGYMVHIEAVECERTDPVDET